MARRRTLLQGAAAGMAFAGPWRHLRVYATQTDRPLRIGITVDLSGLYGVAGASEERAIRMVIAQTNARGGLLGRRLEAVSLDTRSNAERAAEVALDLIDRHGVAFLIGGIDSRNAAAMSLVAQRHGVIYLNTNSSAPSESGSNCHRTKFVWDANGRVFSNAVVRHALRWLGRRWYLLAADYSWGRETLAVTKALVEAAGGQILGERLVPPDTDDFRQILAEIRRADPDVAWTAISGRDLAHLRRDVADAGVGRRPAWIANQQDWPEHWQTRGRNAFGIFATTWYHKLELPGVTEFVRNYRAAWPSAPISVPGNVFHNAYMATWELFRTVESVGTVNNLAVIKALEGRRIPARDRLQHHDAWIDARTHHVQQTIYMATPNPKPSDETDLFSILSHAEPSDVVDPDAAGACRLEPFADVPSYDP